MVRDVGAGRVLECGGVAWRSMVCGLHMLETLGTGQYWEGKTTTRRGQGAGWFRESRSRMGDGVGEKTYCTVLTLTR
jgi:hypothetical protein